MTPSGRENIDYILGELADLRAKIAGIGGGGVSLNNPVIHGTTTYSQIGNTSLLQSMQPADFTSPDGAGHVAFSFAIPVATPVTGNCLTTFDIRVQAFNATDSFRQTFRVSAQSVNGAVTSLEVATVDGPTATGGAGAWTAVAAVAGANVTVTATAAAGVKWSAPIVQLSIAR